MASSTQFLKALLSHGVRINPAVYDFIFPHGPARFVLQDQIATVRVRELNQVELNPQPVPPRDFEVGVALFHEVLRGAIAAAGTDGPERAAKILSFEIDDWCGTKWPRKWPKPRPKFDVNEVLLGASFAAVGLSVGYEGVMAESLEVAADQLANSALG